MYFYKKISAWINCYKHHLGGFMLESLLKLTLNKRETILEKLDEFINPDIQPSLKWKEKPLKINKSRINLSAGDGSIQKKKFLSFIFYAISAETLIYESRLERIESSDVDIIPHHRFVEDRLRNYMGLYELKNALIALQNKNVDYYLFDGSLLGNLIRPFPLDRELRTGTKKEIIKEYLFPLEKELNKNKVEISSSKFAEDIYSKFIPALESLTYLENLESLIVMRELLGDEKKIVAISKTSTRNDYFHSNIPDISLFDRSNKKEGYSQPLFLKVSGEVKREFPVLNQYFRDKEFTIFYARLEDHKNMLKIEVPYKADDDQIENILSILKGNSVEGYPYLLKKAHNDVVIKMRDLERLSLMMGWLEKDGREML